MKRCLLYLLMVLSCCVFAQNILFNSEFEMPAYSNTEPLFWKFVKIESADSLNYAPEKREISFEASLDNPGSFSIRQYELQLVAGESYRFSFDIDAENLRFDALMCVIVNYGWKADAGIKYEKSTLDTKGRTRLEATVNAPPSPNGPYNIAFFIKQATGKFTLHGIYLEPLTEKGRKESASLFNQLHPFMAILAPNRMAIPRDQNHLDIVMSVVPATNVVLKASVDGVPMPDQTFEKYKAKVDVSSYKTGKHHLSIKAVQNGKTLVEREEDFAFAEPLPEYHHTRRGFTEELLNTDVDGKRKFVFVAPSNGWYFIRVATKDGKIVDARLDDSLTLYPNGSYRNETMRNLKRGLHFIILQEGVQGTLQVRAVPMVLKYAGVSPQVSFPSMPPYSWEWHKKHAIGRSSNFGPGGIKPDCLEESKLFGVTYARRYYVNRKQKYNRDEAKKTLEEFNNSLAMTDKHTYYIGMDEFSWSDYGALLNFADISNHVQNIHNKIIMPWILSPRGPFIQGMHHYVIEQFLNMGGGMGAFAFETYLPTQPTEEDARRIIMNTVTNIVDGCEKFFPGSASHILLSFSNMNHPTYITSAHHPNVNFKYFLDLEMNLLANSPAGSKIGGLGYWGCHYADSDVNLWTQELYRHYCCDGNTEMLSKQYGYTYILPYLSNGDFHDNLNGYKVNGEAFVETIPKFSKNCLAFFGGERNAADTVAVLSPGTTLETTAVQLDTKATYKLEYVAADYENVKNEIMSNEPIPVTVELSNAEIIARHDVLDSFNRKKTHPRIHYYVTHFRPTSPTMKLSFTCNRENNRKCTINLIKIEPLFEK